MTVRAPCIVFLVTSLLAAGTVAAQDSAATQPTADQAPPSLAPRTVSGRVVRPGRSGMITVGQAWVTLHRVAADSSGPVDSVRTDANGRYSIHYKPVGGDAVVADGESPQLRRPARSGEGDQQPIRRVRIVEGDAVGEDAGRGHPLPVRRRGEIEEEARETVSGEAYAHGSLAADRVARVTQLEREDVVLDIHPGLARIRVERAR